MAIKIKGVEEIEITDPAEIARELLKRSGVNGMAEYKAGQIVQFTEDRASSIPCRKGDLAVITHIDYGGSTLWVGAFTESGNYGTWWAEPGDVEPYTGPIAD